MYSTANSPAWVSRVRRIVYSLYWLWHYWFSGTCRGYEAWKSLAGIVLTVTGAEALYADIKRWHADKKHYQNCEAEFEKSAKGCT